MPGAVAGPGPAPAGPPAATPPAATPPDGLRPLEVARCSMCGVTVPLGLLVPDGGEACADVRWYCKDARSCTERWIAALPAPQGPALSGPAADAAPPAPDALPAEPPASA